VFGPHVGLPHVGVFDVRPEQRGAPLGLDRDVEQREARAAAALGRLQVDEEGEEARAYYRVGLGVLVVVRPVELARLVLEDLVKLSVVLRHASQVDHAVVHAVDQRVRIARVGEARLAPSLGGQGGHREGAAARRAGSTHTCSGAARTQEPAQGRAKKKAHRLTCWEVRTGDTMSPARER